MSDAITRAFVEQFMSEVHHEYMVWKTEWEIRRLFGPVLEPLPDPVLSIEGLDVSLCGSHCRDLPLPSF